MLKPEKNQKTKIESELETERHSYNNPNDLEEMVTQETRTLEAVKRMIDQQAADLDIVKEQGFDFAIVTDKISGEVIYKTKNPVALQYLFGDEQ